ncbi:MAG TPA: hypothetical protein ENH87_11080 [Pricia antarctica]|uniref:Homeodomain phBC6A51-type domain-containing protein n=1 Tax=Pricia antarctica TaxID=641691 RepID=A0A831VN83_9FLAO|nr:hypothetical protein [Pricia antarctica]
MKKKRDKPGRPSNKELSKTGPKSLWKQTPALITKLETAFAIDCSVVEACAFADISQQTYYRWVKDNPELSERFDRLKHSPILRAKDSVFQALKGNPELAFKYLKSRLPKEFADTLQIESKSLHYHIVQLIQDINKKEPGKGDPEKTEGVSNDAKSEDNKPD